MSNNTFLMDQQMRLQGDPNLFFSRLGITDEKLNTIRSLIDIQKQTTKNQFYRWVLSGCIDYLQIEIQHPQLQDSIQCIFSPFGELVKINFDFKQEEKKIYTEIKFDFWDTFKKCFSEGVFFTNKDGYIIEISDRTTQVFPIYNNHDVLLNRDAIVGTKFEDYLDDASKEKTIHFIKTSQANSLARFEIHIERKNRFLEIKGYTLYEGSFPNGFMFLIFDVSKNIKLEKQLQEAQEAISKKSHLIVLGELAGKIAHEINSPLGAILLTADSAESNIENLTRTECKKHFAMIGKTSVIIGEIIKNLLTFARKDETVTFSQITLKEIFDDVFAITNIGLKNQNIQLEYVFPEDFTLDCRKIQMQQVFLNLISNSITAIKNQNEKWIKIIAAENKGKIEIIMTDSGQGIPSEIADKIMVEYFSTKELGQGLGIGLSICRSVITAHGGTLTLDRGHKNTCFKITLPQSRSAKLVA